MIKVISSIIIVNGDYYCTIYVTKFAKPSRRLLSYGRAT